MKEEQLERLIASLTNAKDVQKNDKKFAAFDFVKQIVGALVVIAISYVAVQIGDLDKSMGVLKNTQENIVRDIKNLMDFAEKPRFTSEDFKTNTAVIVNEIDQLNNSFDSFKKYIEKVIDSNDRRISDLEDNQKIIDLQSSHIKNMLESNQLSIKELNRYRESNNKEIAEMQKMLHKLEMSIQ